MARLAMLSNGQLMVGLNEHGLVHDFYYPYVGLDNLTTSRSAHHKIGVWKNGIFSWVDDGSWEVSVEIENDALVANTALTNNNLGIMINSCDFVDSNHNALIRRLKVTNLNEDSSDIRIFMHQIFEISRGGRGDTALYVPNDNYILDYKGRCSVLAYGRIKSTGQLFDQYSVGNYGIEGKIGTYIDAEDGELSGNPVEHGGVDSVIRFSLKLNSKESETIDYWLITSTSQFQCEQIHKIFLDRSIDSIEKDTRHWWHRWLSIGSNSLHSLEPKLLPVVKKSLMIIKAHCDKRGGILASGDSSIFNYGRDYYCYVWPRDGAYAIWPLIRLGYKEEPKKFFEFCRDTISRDGYLMHKYQPDRAIGSTWHPLVHGKRKELAIQEDETASVLSMLGEYLDYTNDDEFIISMYDNLIQPTANFIAKFLDDQTNLPHPSYDLWEEKFLSTTYTTSTVFNGLSRAIQFAKRYNYPDDEVRWQTALDRIQRSFDLYYDTESKSYRKGFLIKEDGNLLFDNTVDISSLYGVIMFTNIKLDSFTVKNSLESIESKILNLTDVGGVIRYEEDWYMRINDIITPNPWFVCTLWLAQIYILIGRIEEANNLVDWSLNHILHSGVMSEQINPLDGSTVGVAPLVWSHAEMINTALDISKANSTN